MSLATRTKRRHPRARGKGLSVHYTGASGFTVATVEDISLGGLFLRTSEELLPGTPLSLTLVRPGMKKGLALLSVVANLRTPGPGRQAGVGVRFDGLADDTRSRLMVLLVELGLANPTRDEQEALGGAPSQSEPDAVEPPQGVPNAHAAPRPAQVPPPLPSRRAPVTEGGLQVLSAREVALRAQPPAPSGPELTPAAPFGVRSVGTPSRGVPSASTARPHEAHAPARGTLSAAAQVEPFRRSHAPIPLDLEPGDLNQNTAVMSQAEVAQHVAKALAGDWANGVPASPAPLTAAPSLEDRLQLQIRGLLMQLGESEQRVAAQDSELSALRTRVDQLSETVRSQEAQLAQLRGRAGR